MNEFDFFASWLQKRENEVKDHAEAQQATCLPENQFLAKLHFVKRCLEPISEVMKKALRSQGSFQALSTAFQVLFGTFRAMSGVEDGIDQSSSIELLRGVSATVLPSSHRSSM